MHACYLWHTPIACRRVLDEDIPKKGVLQRLVHEYEDRLVAEADDGCAAVDQDDEGDANAATS